MKKQWKKPVAQKVAVTTITKSGWYGCTTENCWFRCTSNAS